MVPGNSDNNSVRSAVALWPVALAIGVPGVLVVVSALPFGADLLWVVAAQPALLLVWAGAAIVAVGIVLAAVMRNAWRRAASAAVLPLLVLVATVAAGPVGFVRKCREWGGILNFTMLHGSYRERAAALPSNGTPKLAVFGLGGMVWASQGIVYDESDEVALPLDRQSPAWRKRAGQTELSCGYTVRPLGDHFYLGSFGC